MIHFLNYKHLKTLVGVVMFFSAYAVFLFTALSVNGVSNNAIPSRHEERLLSLSLLKKNYTFIKGITHVPQSSTVDLAQVFDPQTGTNGGIYNSSFVETDKYGVYNYCNMPHVRATEYPNPTADGYKLKYVEVVHRHHKRTPYASNTFTREDQEWHCDNAQIAAYASPMTASEQLARNGTARILWNVYQDTGVHNPFQTGFNGTCQFPQVTRDGLDDSFVHGQDLYSVYGKLLKFLPEEYDAELVRYRVTNNVITSQVAGALVVGMYPSMGSIDADQFGAHIQGAAFDSLEPKYACAGASNLRSQYQSTDDWFIHLNDTRTQALFTRLDQVSGVDPSSSDWHFWFDHYFDNLSSRMCHNKPLPCEIGSAEDDPERCITQPDAEQVFRLADYEYNYIYRQAQNSTAYSVAKYGVFLSELVHHLERKMATTDEDEDTVLYRHNIAHDGSISILLSALQIDSPLRWPGMGSEVVFELWTHDGHAGQLKARAATPSKYYLRVLYGGQVLESSSMGRLDMIEVREFIGYVREMVGGVGMETIVDICS